MELKKLFKEMKGDFIYQFFKGKKEYQLYFELVLDNNDYHITIELSDDRGEVLCNDINEFKFNYNSTDTQVITYAKRKLKELSL